MKRLLFIFILLPLLGHAHPGVGIVKDSKGNIYYTDLKQVWKIKNGRKTVLVPDVHTHELFVDKKDNLYGEGGYYDQQANKFYHYLWVYRSNGIIDTVIGMKQAYLHQDFSLARDKSGNEYYLKRFLPPHTDTTHIYKNTPDGKETVFATGDFKRVNWLHPQEDGSIFYVSDNAIYKVGRAGTIKLVKEQVANSKPSFKFSENNPMIWGIWQDNAENIYAAVFSDQTVKKIEPDGNIIAIYKSQGNWAPLHGVFDNDNKLWVLEGSDKNDVRVTKIEIFPTTTNQSESNLPAYLVISYIVVAIAIFYLIITILNAELRKLKS